MNYQQAVAFHQEAITYGSILGLDNIKRLMHELGDVWKSLNIIHVAGTNGKGSVCCFLSSMLTEAGYLVGQYNSPAVFSLREVYRAGGAAISKEEYASCMEQVKNACDALLDKGYNHPTVFEIETAVAFLWFAEKKCDLVILEVGMGGSTDATNLITHPLCSVFTSISRDHMKYLGDSIEEIAKIKSGIIKKGHPVVTVHQQKDADRVLGDCAKKLDAVYHVAEFIRESWIDQGQRYFTHPLLGEVQLSMLGTYQVENASLAIKVIDVLQKEGKVKVTEEEIKQGLKKACWPGRFERVCKKPLFYLDGAHNLDGIMKLKETLIECFPEKKKIGIMGVMADKEYGKMAEVLCPLFSCIYTVTPDNPRALSGEVLAGELNRQGIKGSFLGSVGEAVRQAYEIAHQMDAMVIAFGSLYYLNEVKETLHEITRD